MLFDGRIIGGITVFVAVARSGNYGRAAEQVGLSRSGVGKAIARLEERTGMRLFHRNARALTLTDEGRAFLDEVTPLLEKLGQAAAPQRPDEIRGRLRVSTDAAFGPYLLVPALPRLIAAHPKLRVDLLVRDRVDNLLIEGVDVAVRFGSPDARGLNKTPVLRSRVITCATPTYLAKHAPLSEPEQILSDHTCVRLLDDVTGKPHVWNFETLDGRQCPIAPDCGLTVNDAPSLIAAALNDFGIVRLLDFVAEEHLRAGRLVEVVPEWNNLLWPAYLYTLPDAEASPAVQAFRVFVSTYSFATRGPEHAAA